jgi:hypothetical protein
MALPNIEVLTTPMPEDVIYFLDCGSEYGELSIVDNYALSLWGDRVALEDIVNEANRRAGQPHVTQVNPHVSPHMRLHAMSDAILASLPSDWLNIMLCLAVSHIPYLATEAAERYHYWHINDSLFGGCLLPFRKYANGWMVNGEFHINKRTRRRLASPSAIRRYMKHCKPKACRDRDILDKFGPPSEFVSLLPIYKLIGKHHHLIRAQQARAEAERRLAETKNTVRARRLRRQVRKRIVKSYSTAVAIVGEDKTRQFAQGKKVKLEGSSVDLVVNKTSLDMLGHGACGIKVYDKDATELGRLCFFINDTPALDQFSALHMYMQSGEEKEILHTGNLTEHPDAREHPKVVEIKAANRNFANLLSPIVEPIMNNKRERLVKNLPRSVLYADNQSSEFEPMSKFYLEPVLRNMAGKHYRVVLEYARWQSARNPDVYNAEPIYPDEMLDAIGRDRGYEDAGLDMAV